MSRRTVLATIPAIAAVQGVASAPHAVASNYQWELPSAPAGVYLNYLTRGNIAGGSNVRLDQAGTIQVRRGSGYVYNPVTISQYGLQQFSYYIDRGDKAALHRAVLQANWLVANQDTANGKWYYEYAFGVGGMNETLPSGWSSAMAQGQAMSLLSRISATYPTKGLYRHAAFRAKWPMRRSVQEGGLVGYFHDHPYFEEYPTNTPSFALNGFQFTLIGLADQARLGDAEAWQMFNDGFDTMAYALPFHDALTTSAYHLGHLTKAPRKIHHADHYHRIHVLLLGALNSLRPNETVEFYRQLWETYPAMR